MIAELRPVEGVECVHTRLNNETLPDGEVFQKGEIKVLGWIGAKEHSGESTEIVAIRLSAPCIESRRVESGTLVVMSVEVEVVPVSGVVDIAPGLRCPGEILVDRRKAVAPN